MLAGETVVYFDFEDSPNEVVARLKALGVSEQLIRDRFRYIHPEDPLTAEAIQAVEALVVELAPSVAIIDGVTEAMELNDLNFQDNTDIARYNRMLAKRLTRLGVAVVLIDHVTKDREGRGRYSIGGQHKLAAIDGVSFRFEVVEPFSRGRRGKAKITVDKDRPGHVRKVALNGKVVAHLTLDANADGSVVDARLTKPDGMGEDGRFRPTTLMERVSEYLQSRAPLCVNTRDINTAVTGKTDGIKTALECLVDEGNITRSAQGNAVAYRHVRPFRDGDGAHV
jgi:hypothetical protein